MNKIYKRNKEIFDIIKEKLINNIQISGTFFKNFFDFFNIKENKELVNDIIILFNNKKYEINLKNIIYFFSCLPKDESKIKN